MTNDESKNKKSLPAWAKRVKKKLKESGKEMAELAAYAGYSRSGFSLVLHERRTLKTSTIKKIAKFLHSDPNYLLYGHKNKNINDRIATTKEHDIMLIRKLTPRLAPELKWNEARKWREIMMSIEKDKSRRRMPSPAPTDKNVHYYIVKNDSMIAPVGATHSFTVGDLVFVNPDIEPHENDFVIVNHAERPEAEFFQLVKIGGIDYLQPLNPRYDREKLTDDWEIIATVIGKYQNYLRRV
jgi:SOS-response transcriptional repressor LexA